MFENAKCTPSRYNHRSQIANSSNIDICTRILASFTLSFYSPSSILLS